MEEIAALVGMVRLSASDNEYFHFYMDFEMVIKNQYNV